MVKKLLRISLLFIWLSSSNLSSGSGVPITRCEVILNRYGIDADLKSNSGWARVCKYDKLHLYTPNTLSDAEKAAICNCLKVNVKDRAVENFKDGNNE